MRFRRRKFRRMRAEKPNIRISLYSPRRAPRSVLDAELPEESRETLFSRLKERFQNTQTPKVELRPAGVRRKSPRRLRLDADARRFYLAVIGACLVAIAFSVVFSAGIFEPGGKRITVNDAGRKVRAITTERTVGSFLEKNGIALSSSDVLELPKDTELKTGMEIVIRRAVPVAVNHAGVVTKVSMLAGTVQDALTLANITVHEDDEVYPSVDTYVTTGMSIDVIDVEVKVTTQQETIHYKELTKNDAKLAQGKQVVSQNGVDGLREKEIKTIYKNGVEYSKTTVKTTVVKEAVNKITLIGTYVAPTPKPTTAASASKTTKPSASKSSSGISWKTNSAGELTNVPSLTQVHYGTLYEHKSAPPPADSIIAETVVLDDCTAYTHTGNRTATGTWPRIGTVAADPKRFPYGTKVYVPKYGYGRIEDTGSMRHREETLWDLFMDTESDCRTWGRKHNWKVYILK